MTRTLLSALTLCAALAAAGSSAAADRELVTAKVAYAHAELTTQAGAADVAARIRQAARQACGGANPLVASGGRFQDCQRRAIARAARHLDAPLVNAALGRIGSTMLADR